MISRCCFAAFAAFALAFGNSAVQAQDPYAFQFGYTMGYQNSFRNRLPAPPYFSVFPPVYYGKRYERPYGDSPYAAFPQLRSAPDYYPVPKEVPFRTRTVINPHVESHMRVEANGVPSENAPVAEMPAAGTSHVGRTVEIINPFAQERYAGSR
jgi:hypothetical protein